jgi:hypothetical protein
VGGKKLKKRGEEKMGITKRKSDKVIKRNWVKITDERQGERKE